MNFEEIMARLQKGESMDAIAKEVEDTLNAANAAFQEQNARDEKESRLDSLADTIAAAANEYMALARPDVEFEVSGAEMRETLDEMLPLLDLFKNITVKVTSVPVVAKDKPAKTAEDVFAKFFRSMNI